MNTNYTSERNIQIVLSLLKKNGIKKVIASPGSTDVAIVASMQQDSFFEMYSSIDERSAAYMACGMAAESHEPVVIVCTGATSSRNYMPGLTEAYYRHLPILAITCCKSNAHVGQYVNQVTDRSAPPSDTVNISVYLQSVSCPDDEWDCVLKANKAILGLSYNGGGPCHINLATVYSKDFSVKSLPEVRTIKRYTYTDELPHLKGKIGIFVGAMNAWTTELTEAVDKFCEAYDSVVLYDNSSNYKGKYGVLFPLISHQYDKKKFDFDIMIYIGYVSANVCKGKEMWRVNSDGEIRDPFRCTTCVFQMNEVDFFKRYLSMEQQNHNGCDQYNEYVKEYRQLKSLIPELPFSNIWVAQHLSSVIPDNSVIHAGILNSFRSWNFFEVPKSVNMYCNTGGYGIDGGMSSFVGASIVSENKLFFGFFGDLLFYYDMNCLGNRHISSNVRILVVNNGLGQEFKNYTSYGALFGSDTDEFIAARGHFGNRERPIIECYAKSLGFEYLSAATKEEFLITSKRFVTEEMTDKPMLFEVFTDSEDESEALDIMTTLTDDSKRARERSEKRKKVESVLKVEKLRSIAKIILDR